MKHVCWHLVIKIKAQNYEEETRPQTLDLLPVSWMEVSISWVHAWKFGRLVKMIMRLIDGELLHGEMWVSAWVGQWIEVDGKGLFQQCLEGLHVAFTTSWKGLNEPMLMYTFAPRLIGIWRVLTNELGGTKYPFSSYWLIPYNLRPFWAKVIQKKGKHQLFL